MVLSSKWEQSHQTEMHVRKPLLEQLSLTPISFLAVYCYGCDDDVIDEKLAEHLKHFGLDINVMEKTEKTMVELVKFSALS